MKIRGIALVLVLVIVCTGGTAAAKSDVALYIDGAAVTLDAPVWVSDGVPYLPAKSALDALGFRAYIYADADADADGDVVVYVTDGDCKIVECAVDRATAWSYGEDVALSRAPIVRGGGVYLPATALHELFNFVYTYDKANGKLHIRTMAYFPDPTLSAFAHGLAGVSEGELRLNKLFFTYYLDLRDANLRGAVADLTGVEQYPRLMGVYMGGQRIADLSPLSALSRLQYVYIPDNRVTDLSPLAGKPLRLLYLAGNPIRDVDVVRALDPSVLTDGLVLPYFGVAYGDVTRLLYKYDQPREFEETLAYYDELWETVDGVLDEVLVRGMSQRDKLRAIHDWIVDHVAFDSAAYDYAPDALPQYITNAQGVFAYGSAICTGYAEAFLILCERAGIACRIQYGSVRGEKHAWNVVVLDGVEYHVDVTWDDPVPDRVGGAQGAYFLLTEKEMRRDHEF